MIGNNLLLGSGDEGYNLTRSLRFRSSATAYLSRTPASASNQQKWTWSGWVKRGQLGVLKQLFSAGSGTTTFQMYFNGSGGGASSTDGIELYANNSGTQVLYYTSTAVRRDPASWYHIVLAVDTTQATAGNRVLLYVNGASVPDVTGVTVPAQNTNLAVNSTAAHYIGQFNSSNYFDGYLTEVNFIDGQALTPSSFGETDLITGVWKPKAYSGTYGTNGFELQFTDNSAATAAAIGKDSSGNGNNWTPNNISVTAGVTYDSMTDVPTLTSATAANFAVLNPLQPASTTVVIPTDGNLKMTGTPSGNNVTGTMAIGTTTYFEGNVIAGSGTVQFGIKNLITGNNYVYDNSGVKSLAGSSSAYGASFTTNDIIGVAVDPTNLTLQFYKNGTSQGVISAAFPSGSYVAFFYASNANASAANFGQRPFAYTPPTGFVALNTFNLPTPTIVKGNTVMDATLYTGTAAALSITNAAAFKPDLVWIKNRSNTGNHGLVDSVRGRAYSLYSDLTSAEGTSGSTQDVTSFNSNGFSLGTQLNFSCNASGNTYVGWQWQAGQGTNTTNTSGTITSTVSVNASAGFSVVTYTAQASGVGTFGHGLGVAPSLVITKERVTTPSNWSTYHTSVGNTAFLTLNTTNASVTSSAAWNNTSPTSSVFTLGSAFAGAGTMVAYCWTPIAGYSAFGSYTGNGSNDGPFVYLGFRPKFVLFKATNNAQDWVVYDSARDTYNSVSNYLFPNSSAAEASFANTNFLSNGFKLISSVSLNYSGYTYIYMAFAENPFKNALAR
jgi:hypothetical protein